MTPSSLILLILALRGSPIRGEAPPFRVNKLKEWMGGKKGGGTGDSGGWEGFVASEGRDSSCCNWRIAIVSIDTWGVVPLM